ncbi:hypothetical protein [Kineosporia sp. NBRC 101731]|uniref:hypothetical protein n=1 Tax=Kineosporia sp. NBRC 101731 TaxID=3032199 RepID=UPI00249F9A07|nr:hypothetical protein [Kineosporia sp. NBRC 101731]GLY32293.1 hypothetical protein Kisp02_56580 [Kineosporia sp. NBRC 101731]
MRYRALRSLVLLSVVMLVSGLTACQSQHDGESGDSLEDITLSKASVLPPDLDVLGSGQAWELPSGRSVAGSGARQVGHYLLMPVDADHVQATQTWVMDMKTGATRRYASIDEGWIENMAIGAGDWMLRSEVMDPSSGGCTGADEDGCYSWRLYAQPLDSTTPRLLAESQKPGRRASVPSLVTDGRQIGWQQGDASGRYPIYRWEPGARTADVVAERDQPGALEFTDDGRLFVLETAPGAEVTDTVYLKSLTQIRLPGPKQIAPVTTFLGLMYYDVIGQTVTYFPQAGDGHGNWLTVPLGSKAGTGRQGELINPGIDGPYAAAWITDTKLLSSSATGTTVYDLKDPALTVTSESTDLTTARVSNGSVVIGYQPPDDGPALVYVKKYD